MSNCTYWAYEALLLPGYHMNYDSIMSLKEEDREQGFEKLKATNGIDQKVFFGDIIRPTSIEVTNEDTERYEDDIGVYYISS